MAALPRTTPFENRSAALEVNVPDRFELYLLDIATNEKRVTVAADSRIANTAVFTFNREDHTLGNLLAQRLHKSPNVVFSAYITPHPLFAKFELRVTTNGEVTPKEALDRACKDIVSELDVLGREFTKEWELKKVAEQGAANGI